MPYFGVVDKLKFDVVADSLAHSSYYLIGF